MVREALHVFSQYHDVFAELDGFLVLFSGTVTFEK